MTGPGARVDRGVHLAVVGLALTAVPQRPPQVEIERGADHLLESLRAGGADSILAARAVGRCGERALVGLGEVELALERGD